MTTSRHRLDAERRQVPPGNPLPGDPDHLMDQLVVAQAATRAALGKQEFIAGRG